MRNKARSGRASMRRRPASQRWRGRCEPRRRAGFLEIRRDSTRKNGHSVSYPQGCVVGRGAGSQGGGASG
ncbi:hypothetical protein DIE19_16060 [Burkholderia sp. Bp9126]|nr:hypothetical protein DIE19_16060 [Burkholderia sp. Bp9126]